MNIASPSLFQLALTEPWPETPSAGHINQFSKLAKQNCAMMWIKGAGMRLAGPMELPGFWTAWSDGSFEPETGRSAIGGVLRDEQGTPVALFSRQSRALAHEAGPLEAERSALLEALTLAADAGARRVEARFDCLPLLLRVLRFERVNDPLEALNAEHDIAQALNRFEEVALRWIPRGKNQLADALSKRPSGRGALCGGKAAREVFDDSLLTGAEFPLPAPPRAPAGWPNTPPRLPPPIPRPGEPKSAPLVWAMAACWSPRSGWLGACGKLLKKPSGARVVNALPKSKTLWWSQSRERGVDGAVAALSEAFALRADRDAPKIAPGQTARVAMNASIFEWLDEEGALPALEARMAEALARRSPGALIRVTASATLGEELEAAVWIRLSDPGSVFPQQARALRARQGLPLLPEEAPPPAAPAEKLTPEERQRQFWDKSLSELRERLRLSESIERHARALPAPRIN